LSSISDEIVVINEATEKYRQVVSALLKQMDYSFSSFNETDLFRHLQNLGL
jgi:hypothetical protein